MCLFLSGIIVWIRGPFKCGEKSDLSIFREEFRQNLSSREVLIAEATYLDNRCIYNDGMDLLLLKSYRARHESVFGRLKSFNVLNHRFRHEITKHSSCLFAAANLVQIALKMAILRFKLSKLAFDAQYLVKIFSLIDLRSTALYMETKT